MYTLIEIFDSKQYENVITPSTLDDISKVVYVGTKNIMTSRKKQAITDFFKRRNISFKVEFFTIERDDSVKAEEVIEYILSHNCNCIFDATGGEDVILTIVGACAQAHSVPIVRTNPVDGKVALIRGEVNNLKYNKASLTLDDIICLQGGNIIHSTQISTLSIEECADIKKLFKVNAYDCEAYSLFINFISEYMSDDLTEIVIPYEKFHSLSVYRYKKVKKILDMLLSNSLIRKFNPQKQYYSFKIKNKLIALCLKKSGNILEYYTAMAVMHSRNLFKEIRLGTTIEWNSSSNSFDTQNEIDVMTVSDNFPVFISCKNGSIKKDALYELDAVSRALGGAYTKKVLVCTYISENASSREHFIKRAKDMNIQIIYDVHKMTYEQFLNYLKISVY